MREVLPHPHIVEMFSFLCLPPCLGVLSQSPPDSVPPSLIWTITLLSFHHENNLIPWCFQTIVLEKTLEGPLDCKVIKPVNPKGNQHWIFTGRTDSDGQYFGHLMWRADWLEKTPVLGKIGGKRKRGNKWEWDGWMASPTWWTWVWASSSSSWWTGKPGVLQFMGLQRVGYYWGTE